MNGTSASKRKRDAFSGKVYLLKDGKPEAANVSLGITDNRNTEIRSGDIKVGDLVVIGEAQANSQSTSSAPMRMRMF